MEFYIEQREFNSKLDKVKKAVPARTPLPILECVYIKAEDDVKIIASSLDFEISDVLEGNIVEKGEACVNAKLLMSLISKLPNNNIKITCENKKLIIACNKKKYELPIIFGDFPFIERNDFSEPIIIDNFASRVANVAYAVSPDDQNPLLTGVCIRDGKIAALDSHRIAVNDFVDIGKEIVVPGKYLKTVTSENVEFSYDDKFIKIKDETNITYIKLLEGKYFDVDKFTNDFNSQTTISVNRESLIENLQTLSLFIKDTDRKPVVFDIKNENLILSVNTTIGRGEEEIEIKKEGEDLKIGFNPKFVIEALSHINDETVTIEMKKANNPAMIIGEDYFHLILPVTI